MASLYAHAPLSTRTLTTLKRAPPGSLSLAHKVGFHSLQFKTSTQRRYKCFSSNNDSQGEDDKKPAADAPVVDIQVEASSEPSTDEEPQEERPPRRTRRLKTTLSENPSPGLMSERLFASILSFWGASGTIAVFVAWLAHMDAFGNFHWDANDVKLGLIAMLPVYAANLAILYPDYSSWRLPSVEDLLERRNRSKGQPNSSRSADPQVTDSQQSKFFSRIFSDARGLGSTPMKDGLNLAQGSLISRHPSFELTPGMEGLVILLECLCNEMARRAVALTLLSGWLSDRLYEAGVDDAIVIGDYTLSTPEASKWLAVSCLALIGFGFLLQKATKPYRRQAFLLDLRQQTAKQATSMSIPTGALDAVALASIFGGLRDIGQLLGLSASFILTGNLAAPFFSSVLNQLLLSALQRRAWQRTRDKSTQLAKELRHLNLRIKRMSKQREKEAQDAGAQVGSTEPMRDEENVAAIARAAAALEEAAASTGINLASVPDTSVISTSSMKAVESRGGSVAAASHPEPSVDSPSSAIVLSTTEEDVSASSADKIAISHEPRSRMERTLNNLDMLLPPEVPR